MNIASFVANRAVMSGWGSVSDALPYAHQKGLALRQLPVKRDAKEETMDWQWRRFLLISAFAASVVTPAFGQAVAGQANGGNEGAESIPDFSGFWLHPLPGFEPLPSGPTALVN